MGVPLVMVHVRMITVVVTVPAAVIAPMPTVVLYETAHMLISMTPLVFACMTNFVVVTIVAPFMSSIAVVVLDNRSTNFECETRVLMFSAGR